jgi:hypothetical protein
MAGGANEDGNVTADLAMRTFSGKDLLDPEAGQTACTGLVAPRNGEAMKGPRRPGGSRWLPLSGLGAWAPESRAYAVLNDSERGAQPTVRDALQSYKMRPIPWSKRAAVTN